MDNFDLKKYLAENKLTEGSSPKAVLQTTVIRGKDEYNLFDIVQQYEDEIWEYLWDQRRWEYTQGNPDY